MKTSLEHLPEPKREQIQAIAAIVQAGAPAEMVVLFGSHARGDWVDDPENGYFSDFDVLVVVAGEELARNASLWADVSGRARLVAGRTPVSILVHDIKEVNQEIRLGHYFFKDILREGVLLYTSRRHSFATVKTLVPAEQLRLGLVNFRYWFGSANEFWRTSGHSAGRGLGPQAAFLLPSSSSPITRRRRTTSKNWRTRRPRCTRRWRERCRAARRRTSGYSPSSSEDTSTPVTPRPTRSPLKSKGAGISEGEQRGLVKALFTILAARDIPVDPATRARIEACTDPAALNRWIAQAMTIQAAAELLAPGSERL